MGRISSKLTYANVMSTLALFAALGGGAYAASKFVAPGGVVDLCVSKSGAVKVLAANKSKCGKGASLVPINQQGPAGKQGPAGTQGSAYSAGTGLTLAGTSFGADLTKLQARIAGSGCAAGQALQSVAQDGTPACTGLHAYSSTAGVANYLQNNTATVVPAGNWLLMGQAEAATAGVADSVNCLLQVNSHTVDTIVQAMPASSNYTISPIATTTTAGPSNVVQILCTAGSGSTTIGGNLTIVALPLAALN